MLNNSGPEKMVIALTRKCLHSKITTDVYLSKHLRFLHSVKIGSPKVVLGILEVYRFFPQVSTLNKRKI